VLRAAFGAGLLAIAPLAMAQGCVIPINSVGATDGGNTSEGAIAGDATLPTGTWTNVTSNLANLPSQCGNMSSVFTKPDEDVLIAGVAAQGLWASKNGNATWELLGGGTADAGDGIFNRPLALVYDPRAPSQFWESGIYDSNAFFLTKDDGATFTALGAVDPHGSDLLSVDLTDPNRKTLIAGGHEQPQTLYKSTDGGLTWANVGAGLPAGSNSSYPLVLDALTYLVGCGGIEGGPSGVYRTADGGSTWAAATASGGGAAPLWMADGLTIYWPGPRGAGMTRSSDKGQTWSDVTGAGVLSSVQPIELPDHRIATIAGSQSGPSYVAVSSDGATWTPVSSALPYGDASGLVYSAARKAFYIWHFTCGSGTVPVPADAIMSYAFDYQSG
jgi:hypothetical protein